MKRKTINSIILILLTAQIFSQGENLSAPEYKPFGLPLGQRISSFDVVDINNDSIPDAAVSYLKNDTSTILIKLGPDLNDILTSPDFTFKFSSPIKKTPLYIAWSDIDQDNDFDIYVGENSEYNLNAKIYILENQSAGTLQFVLNNSFSFDIETIVAIPSPIDFNNDGLEDLFVSNYTGEVNIYQNNGSFSFTKLPSGAMGLTDFNLSCAFDQLSNSKNLISFDAENGFNLFLFNGSTYQRDTTIKIIYQPDELNTKFMQPRIRDLDFDGINDAFISSNTFSVNNNYYTDTWFFKGICIDSLIKNEMPIPNGNYSVGISIESAGSVTSPLGVYFKAGEEIQLNPNFSISNGAIFEAIIGDCYSSSN